MTCLSLGYLEKKKLDYYIESWCSKGLCRFQYYPDCGLKPGRPKDGNMTDLLTSSTNLLREVPKSIHQVDSLFEVNIHTAKLMKGSAVSVPPEKAIVAHVRKHAPVPGNKC